MAGQVLAATILYFSGVHDVPAEAPLRRLRRARPPVLPLITAIWVFALSNAVNLIDGLDGLAAGIVAIASGTLGVYGLRLEDLGLLPATTSAR